MTYLPTNFLFPRMRNYCCTSERNETSHWGLKIYFNLYFFDFIYWWLFCMWRLWPHLPLHAAVIWTSEVVMYPGNLPSPGDLVGRCDRCWWPDLTSGWPAGFRDPVPVVSPAAVSDAGRYALAGAEGARESDVPLRLWRAPVAGPELQRGRGDRRPPLSAHQPLEVRGEPRLNAEALPMAIHFRLPSVYPSFLAAEVSDTWGIPRQISPNVFFFKFYTLISQNCMKIGPWGTFRLWRRLLQFQDPQSKTFWVIVKNIFLDFM